MVYTTVSNRNLTEMSESEELRKRVPQDFEFGRLLGEGSYSTVLYCIERNTPNEYAVKILEKQQIIREKKVRLINAGKDAMSLYFVLQYCQNGDLLQILNKYGRLSIENTIGYMQEIVSAVEYMHTNNVIHRDLKPENILLASSFVGTAEYCSPELLNNKECSFSSDVWSLGCILYQLSVGVPPFKGSNEYQTFQRILNSEYELPIELDEKSKSLIAKILVAEQERIDINGIKRDPLFSLLDWEISRLQSNTIAFEYIEPLRKPQVFIDQFEPDFQAEIDTMDEQFQDLKYVEGVDTDSEEDIIQFIPDQYNYEIIHFSLVKQKNTFFSRIKGLILTKELLVMVDLKTKQCTEMNRAEIETTGEEHEIKCDRKQPCFNCSKHSINCSYEHSKRAISTGIIEHPPSQTTDSYPTPTTDKSSLSVRDYDLEFKFVQESMLERYSYFSSMTKDFLSKYLQTDFAAYVLRAGYYINKRDEKANLWIESSMIAFPTHLEPNLSNLLTKYGRKIQGVGVFGHVVRASKLLGINDEQKLQLLVKDEEKENVRSLWWHIYQIDQYLWFHNAGFLHEDDHNVHLPGLHGEFDDRLGVLIMSSKDWFTPPLPNESINANKILLNRIFGQAIRLQREGNDLQMSNLQGSLQLWYMNLPEKFHLHFRLIYDYNPLIENPEQTWKILDTLIKFHFTKIMISEPMFYKNFQTVQLTECTSTEQSMLYICKQMADIFSFYLQQNPLFEYTPLFTQIYLVHIMAPLFLISKIRIDSQIAVDQCISILYKSLEALCRRHGDEFGNLARIENWFLLDARSVMLSFNEFNYQMSHL
ncbi:3-phosphoinositide dependent protein kinase-1 [Terramyces sp. JEL0728]|nr:3-phosphoinositide dependent protein kinase-1 [Terramyces sp. JEL0728]